MGRVKDLLIDCKGDIECAEKRLKITEKEKNEQKKEQDL